MTVLRFAGVIVVFAGVALFGIFFIRGNARATDGRVPTASWWGAGPKKGMRIVGLGTLMLGGAYLIGLFMPNGL